MTTAIQTGVYRIRNMIDGKVYIGSSTRSFRKRWAEHRNHLRLGKHHSVRLQRAWNKHSEESFIFEIVERCAPQFCIAQEQVFLTWLRPTDPKLGYNNSPTAGSSFGAKHSDESRLKMSRTAKTRPPVSDETRKKLSQAGRGRRVGAETRQKIGRANSGKVRSDELRRRISATNKGRRLSKQHRSKISEGLQNRSPEAKAITSAKMSAKTVSNETRAKLSAAKIGKSVSHEVREKISAANRGKKRSAESRERMSIAHRGKIPSPESLEKRRQSMIAVHAEKRAKSASLLVKKA